MPPIVAQLIKNITGAIIQPVVSALFILAVLVMIWGIVEFIWNADNDAKRKTGKDHLIWGVVGLFVMISVMGIITLVLQTFDIPTNSLNNPFGM